MRRRFGRIIAELADIDPSIYVISGDIGYRVFDEFRERHPKRFINIGICEQSMIGVSAGMALEGLQPWVYTITPFLIERPFEQIKLDINQQRANVKLVGYADYPTLGTFYPCRIGRSSTHRTLQEHSRLFSQRR